MAEKQKVHVTFKVVLQVGVDVTANSFAEAEEAAKKFKPLDLVKVLPGKELNDWDIDIHWMTKDLG
jgi:hypothetical protein